MFTDMAKTKINNNNFNHIRNKLNSEMIYSSFLTPDGSRKPHLQYTLCLTALKIDTSNTTHFALKIQHIKQQALPNRLNGSK